MKKILVVDDEALLVKGIRFNLQNDGYEVITGADGVQHFGADGAQGHDRLGTSRSGGVVVVMVVGVVGAARRGQQSARGDSGSEQPVGYEGHSHPP